MATNRVACPWGYRYNKNGTSRSVNRKHQCNISCWERWDLWRCLEWARVTPLRFGPGPNDTIQSVLVSAA
jgi:hypothetical protein